MLIKNQQVFLPIGSFCLVGAIVLRRFGPDLPHLAFVEGVLIGASLVFNIAYLVRTRSKRGQ
jgi:hypothetical protein